MYTQDPGPRGNHRSPWRGPPLQGPDARLSGARKTILNVTSMDGIDAKVHQSNRMGAPGPPAHSGTAVTSRQAPVQ